MHGLYFPAVIFEATIVSEVKSSNMESCHRVVEMIERSVDVLIEKWKEIPRVEQDDPDITITVSKTNSATDNVGLMFL